MRAEIRNAIVFFEAGRRDQDAAGNKVAALGIERRQQALEVADDIVRLRAPALGDRVDDIDLEADKILVAGIFIILHRREFAAGADFQDAARYEIGLLVGGKSSACAKQGGKHGACQKRHFRSQCCFGHGRVPFFFGFLH
jgi:hypothetical protein